MSEKTATTETKELSPSEKNALETYQAWSDYAGLGAEDAPQLPINTIKILQPQDKRLLDENHAFYQGTPGRIYSRSDETFIDELVFIPCRVRELYYERSGLKRGEGDLLAIHFERPGKPQWDKERGILRSTMSHYIQTHIYIGLRMAGVDVWEAARLDFRSTALSVSRTWLAMLTKPLVTHGGSDIIRPPMFTHAWSFNVSKHEDGDRAWFAFDVPERKGIVNVKGSTYELARVQSEQALDYFESMRRMRAVEAAADVEDDIPF